MFIDMVAAERSTIGSILIDPSVLPAVRSVVSPGDFAVEELRTLYSAACALADANQRVDAVTILNRAGASRELVSALMDDTPTAAAHEHYAKLVRENARRRALSGLGMGLGTRAVEAGEALPDLLSEVQAQLDELAGDTTVPVLTSPKSLLAFQQFRNELEAGNRTILRTGFPSLDGLLGGLLPGTLHIVAARPAIGKTALGIAIADMVATRYRVLFVSLEMSAEELTARRVAAKSGIAYNLLLYAKELEPKEEQLKPNSKYRSIAQACHDLSGRKLSLSQCETASVAELAALAQRVKPELLMIDYLGLISPSNKRASEYEQITEISGDLKRLARHLGIPILCLCQLNREAALGNSDGDRRPALTNLRSSGAIEQDADSVMLLHRPAYYLPPENQPKPWNPQLFEINVAKNRHGATGTIKLRWYAGVNHFIDEKPRKYKVRSWEEDDLWKVDEKPREYKVHSQEEGMS